MADTPKSSPESQTYGQLYEKIRANIALTPDEQKTLQKKIMLNGFLARKDEIITDAEKARNELSLMLTDSPLILAKLNHALDAHLPTGKSTLAKAKEQGNKLVARVDASIPPEVKEGAEKISTEAKALGNKMANAIPDAPEGMKQALGKLGENISTSTVAITAAGAAVIAAPTIEGKVAALDTIGSTIKKGWESLTDIIAAVWKFFTNGFSFPDLWADLKSAVGMGEKKDPKTLAEDVKKKGEKGGEKINEVLISPEKLTEKIKKQYWDKLVESGYIKDPKTQWEKFEKIFAEYQGRGMINITQKALEDATTNKEWNIWNAIGDTITIQGKFALSLVTEGVIPMEAIGMSVLDMTKKSFRIWLKSPYTLIDKGAMGFLGEFGELHGKDITQMKEAEKTAILGILHHNMVIPLYIAGAMTSTLARIGLLGAYWEQGIGVTKLQFAGSAITGDFAKATDHMDELMRMFTGKEKEFSETKKYVDGIKQIIEESQIRGRIAEIYTQMSKAGKGPSEIANALDAMKGEYIKIRPTYGTQTLDALIGDIRLSNSANVAKDKIITYFSSSTPGNRGWLQTIQGSLRSIPMNDLDFMMNNAKNSFGEFNRNLISVVNNADFAPARWLANARAGIKGAELLGDLEKGHLTVKVKQGEDAAGIVQQITKSIPEGFKHFFSALSVTVIVADVASKESTADKLITAAKDIAALNPVYGGIMLLHEGATMEGFAPTKIGYLIMGTGVFALGARDIAKLVATPSPANFARFAFSPIYTIANAGASLVRGANFARHAVMLGGIRGLAPFMRIGAVAGITIAAGIGYLLYENLLKEETKKEMQKAGFFKPDGTIDEPNVKTNLQKIPEGKRSDVVNDILGAIFSGSNITPIYGKDGITLDTINKGAPMLDQVEILRKITSDMGMGEKIFYSGDTVAKIKQYIGSMPITDTLKKDFASKYGIDLSKLG